MKTLHVAISGMGVFCSVGTNTDEFMASLSNGRSGITANTLSELPIAAGAFLPEFDLKTYLEQLEIPPEVMKRGLIAAARLPVFAQVAVYTALQAWFDAGLFAEKQINRGKIGIVVAGQNTNTGYSYRTQKEIGEQLNYISPSYGINFLDTNLIGVISEILDIHGQSFCVGGASATGNLALIQACQMIRSELLDVCLVVGVPADISPLEAQAWLNMGAMRGGDISAEESCRPFDSNHGGFIYGQGSGVVVLESVRSTVTRKHQSRAYCRGEGVYLDGNRLVNPNKEGQIEAMTLAIENAGISVDEIDYINAHGSSSPLGDKTEVESIKTILASKPDKVWINSTKSIIGHCLYSAGLMEAVAVVLQMQNGVIHSNLNLYDPIDTELAFVQKRAVTAEIRYALSNSYGFGGINSSIVFSP